MKKFITVLIGCSVALAVSVNAEQADPKKQKKAVQRQQVAPKPHVAPKLAPKPRVAPNPYAGPKPHVAPKLAPNPYTAPKPHVAPKLAPNPYTAPKPHVAPKLAPNPYTAPKPRIAPRPELQKPPVLQPNKPVVQPNQLPGVQPNRRTAQKIQPRHQNFQARPNPAVTSAQFNRNYRIRGADHWNGRHYDVFRNYHPQWHDRSWWHRHHNRVVLIGGGWYFWNAGYWFPAWGYDASASYYPYDGPIYVGSTARPFDQVVADVQSVLQEQGFYRGEIDGLVGPLTQEALASYQSAQGLEQTAAIDEPTLDSLGLT